jgi:hypothetical protein
VPNATARRSTSPRHDERRGRFPQLSVVTRAQCFHYWPSSQRGAALAGGRDAWVRWDQLAPSRGIIGNPENFTGIYALDKVGLFSITIPDVTRAKPGSPIRATFRSSIKTPSSARRLITKMSGALFSHRPPPDVRDVPTAVDWKTAGLTVLHDTRPAIRALRVADATNGFQLRTFAPCGVVAACARTDATARVKAPPAWRRH